jgi:quercetin dioxygenase-like cupin family protein
MDKSFWLLDIEPKVSHEARAATTSTISPIPLPRARGYEIIYAYVAVPPGAHSAIHVQSGPEAWYVLAGSQCVETPDTVLHIAQGGGGMVPADTPLYLIATGTSTRRAFFVIVHDTERPFYTEIDSWHPKGRCETAP